MSRPIRSTAVVAMTTVAVFNATIGCRGPTELRFRITTDVPCSSVRSTAVSVGNAGTALDQAAPTSVSTACDDSTHLLGVLVVVPSGANNADVAVRFVTGLAKSADDCIRDGYAGGCIVARRALRFIPHTPLDVSIEMAAACADVPCNPDQTCVGGKCVAVTSCVDAVCSSPAPPKGWRPVKKTPLLGARAEVMAAAVGRKVFIWGGYADPGGGTSRGYTNDGALYDPTVDDWSALPPTNAVVRGDSAVVKTDAGDVVVWGGKNNIADLADGLIYHPFSHLWDPISAMPGPLRVHPVVVWSTTTHELLVFGGSSDGQPPGAMSDGMAYDPAAKIWRQLPSAPSAFPPRVHASGAFSGGRATVFGGMGPTGAPLSDMAFFDPKSNTWAPPVPSTLGPRGYAFMTALGSNAVVWGGTTQPDRFGPPYGDGAILDGTGKLAEAIGPASVFVPPGRNAPAAAFTSDARLIVWGDLVDGQPVDTGGVWTASTRTWVPVDPQGRPSARSSFAFVWTGLEAVAYGGFDANGTIVDDGAAYVP